MNMRGAASTDVSATYQQDEKPPSLSIGDDEKPPSTTLRGKFFSNIPEVDWSDWKWHFRNRITSVEHLSRFIPLSAADQAKIRLTTSKYPFSITPYYLSLINPEDPDDPIRRQAVPCFDEIALSGMGEEDPLAERHDSVVPGLVHRYPDRVLMTLTNICPMLCRHCTRKREWKNGTWVRSQDALERMLEYIRNNKTIRDVIISGGDCLILSTPRLERVLASLRSIEHVEIIRIGTRFPVVLPQRIDDELCEMLSNYGPIWLNTHFNNPNELTPEAARACDRLLRNGIPVNNQSVLLRGVNDSVDTQLKLCHGLLKIKVRPYYLFHADEVEGTEHLRTSIEKGIEIVGGMRGYTSGLAVPTYVVDLPGGAGKVPLQRNYLLSYAEDEVEVANYQGKRYTYRNPQPSSEDMQECSKVACIG
ncbi:MAG: KamA family radical SAM protein [Pseudomonadota bacterium]